MNHAQKLIPVALAAALLLGGAAKAYALTQDEITKLSGPDRQKILEEGAKKEGEFFWYTTLDVDVQVRPLHEAWTKKYPFVKPNFIRATSAEAQQRASAEKRANSVRVDVIATGATDALAGSGLLQSFDAPVLAEYNQDYVDPKHEWVAWWVGYNGVAWNTKMVAANEVPKSWDDIASLNPKFKGKISWPVSPAQGGPRLITHIRQVYGEDKALEWIKKLSALDIRTSPESGEVLLQKVALGEYAFTLASAMQTVARQVAIGAPVNGSNLNPAMVRPSSIALLKDAPHPYSAMLFMDFALSKDDGQRVLSETYYIPGHPKVEPRAEVKMALPRLNGVGEIFLSAAKEAEMTPKSVALMKQYFRGD